MTSIPSSDHPMGAILALRLYETGETIHIKASAIVAVTPISSSTLEPASRVWLSGFPVPFTVTQSTDYIAQFMGAPS